jgi:fructose-specific component phosphotransferase system IIB-like protein
MKMVKERIIDVIKSATEVNLRYSAITLKLAREYIKEFDGLVRDKVAGTDPDRPGGDTGATAPERRPPILLVGAAGAEATGAFVLNNTAEADLNVALVVQGDLGPARAELVPATFVISPGGSAVVQLKVAIAEGMEAGRDYCGAVVAPGLSAPAIEFVVRRLPGDPPSTPASKARAPRSRPAG